MIMNFKNKLEEYRNLTIYAIEMVKNDQDIKEIITKKNNILEEIKKEKFDEEELKEIIKEFNIEKIENELVLIIKKEMANTKRKIDNLNKANLARMNYKKSEYQPTLFRGNA